ncbi:Hypothetical protein PHPALM_7910 [Phytophthora palmivora]|uniref:Uncharacterized protein n=1 Tax=Phytophthora palmivora TaxID=4796 RepID=A0A2P4YB42_9STRA|nr:Hypothetical protein PHPALM_7910 [Phytophthora palmivora]
MATLTFANSNSQSLVWKLLLLHLKEIPNTIEIWREQRNYIDLFCRIMTEWSLQLMRSSYQHNSTSQVTSSMSSLSMDKRIQYSSPRAPLATPYVVYESGYD